MGDRESEMIPFNKPSIEGSELEYVRQSIANGHISGDGVFTRRASASLERIIGAGKVLLTTSCTHALEMSAILLDLRPGDEVIVPAFTFVTGVNAFVLRGARPVFADVRPDTLNIDENGIERLITPRTRAIVPVHYAGVACSMDAIMEIAQRREIAIVEDNAHGLFGEYKGRQLGTFGRLATQSFHETKNVSCGEGGALVINDASLIERAEIIREKGTDRSRFFRGQVDKYTWVDLGSSYLPSDMLAAYLLGQLEQATSIQEKRKAIWQRYCDELSIWASENGIALPSVPSECGPAFHMFHLLMPTLAARTALIAWLRERGVFAVFHYVPLNTTPMGMSLGGSRGQCPVAESASERLVRLPFFNSLSAEEQARVIESVLAWRP